MNVITQQSIASGLFQILSIIYPDIILAGGAPRDWWFDRPASDLDFYAHGVSLSTLPTIALAGNNLKLCTDVYGDVAEEMGVDKTYNFIYKNTPVQLMNVNKPVDPDKLINSMSTGLSKSWFDKDMRHHRSAEFNFCILTKQIVIKPNTYKPHLDKIKGKFPGWTMISEREALDQMLQKWYVGGR